MTSQLALSRAIPATTRIRVALCLTKRELFSINNKYFPRDNLRKQTENDYTHKPTYEVGQNLTVCPCGPPLLIGGKRRFGSRLEQDPEKVNLTDSPEVVPH